MTEYFAYRRPVRPPHPSITTNYARIDPIVLKLFVCAGVKKPLAAMVAPDVKITKKVAPKTVRDTGSGALTFAYWSSFCSLSLSRREAATGSASSSGPMAIRSCSVAFYWRSEWTL